MTSHTGKVVASVVGAIAPLAIDTKIPLIKESKTHQNLAGSPGLTASCPESHVWCPPGVRVEAGTLTEEAVCRPV